MRISELDRKTVERRLGSDGLFIEIGPFIVHVKSDIKAVADNIVGLYSEYCLTDPDFADFHIELIKSGGIRSIYKPQVRFMFDGTEPFKPLPYAQSFAFFEWGLNWCIAAHAHQYLILHSAVLEKGGEVVFLPGSPGAGKSTLTVALMNNGWRLFSDEMALIDVSSQIVSPIPRPVSLKNESVPVIKEHFPHAEFGLIATDTHKGTVTHIKPLKDSVAKVKETAVCRWIIFPKYQAHSELRTKELSKTDAYMRLAEQCFNYHVQGEKGFESLTTILDAADTFSLQYSVIDEAVEFFNSLESPLV